MKLGTQTGSLINHVATTAKGPIPEVGMGATICGWSDRHAGTIIKVTPKTVTVQQDIATRVDKNGMSESQQYTYKPNPDGATTTYRLTKHGFYRFKGTGVVIGLRDEFYDFSF